MCGYRNIIAKNTFNWTFGGRNVNGYRWPKTDHTTEFSTGKGMMCDTVAYEVNVFIHSSLSSVSFSMSFWFFFLSSSEYLTTSYSTSNHKYSSFYYDSIQPKFVERSLIIQENNFRH